MEEYLTFASPELLDLNKLMLWVFIGSVIASIILFALWSMHHHKAYPVISTIISSLGIVTLVSLYFLGPLYNNHLAGEAIADDYGVVVTDVTSDHDFVAAHDGQLYPCEASSFDQERYYAVCGVKSERLLLNDITADPEK